MKKINLINYKSEKFNSSNNVILCIEALLPLIDNLSLKNDLLLLSIRNNEKHSVIPTLSVIKKKDIDSQVFKSVSEIKYYFGCNHVKGNSKKEIISISKNNNFKVKYFENNKLLVIYKSEYDLIEIKKITTIFYIVRQKSINLLNDSLQLADRNRKDLSEKMTVNISNMVDYFSEYVTDQYNIKTYSMRYDQDKKNGSVKMSVLY